MVKNENSWLDCHLKAVDPPLPNHSSPTPPTPPTTPQPLIPHPTHHSPLPNGLQFVRVLYQDLHSQVHLGLLQAEVKASNLGLWDAFGHGWRERGGRGGRGGKGRREGRGERVSKHVNHVHHLTQHSSYSLLSTHESYTYS